MSPSPRTVLYALTDQDAKDINGRRFVGPKAERTWHPSAQAHFGNQAKAGDVLPMIVVRAWPDGSVNGQVFLDGNDTLWVTSRRQVPADISDDQKQGHWFEETQA
jgi:hypothetical protein